MSQEAESFETYLKKFLKVAPFSHSIWRAEEAIFLKKHIKNSKVLDIGCGFGEFSGVFFSSQVDTGIDISEDDIQIARDRNVYKNLLIADATELPFEDNKFNCVISVSTLEHIPNSKQAIIEAYRVLQEGGSLIITVPTNKINNDLLIPTMLRKINLNVFAARYVDFYNKIFKHQVMKEASAWEKDLEAAGFGNIVIENILTKRELRTYELMLIFSIPSQILRLLTGKRHVIGFKLRESVCLFIYHLLNKEDKVYNEYNVLISAEKK